MFSKNESQFIAGFQPPVNRASSQDESHIQISSVSAGFRYTTILIKPQGKGWLTAMYTAQSATNKQQQQQQKTRAKTIITASGPLSWEGSVLAKDWVHSLLHRDQCREDQVDDKQHQRHQQGDLSKRIEA